jgi:glucose-6-phosphate 1-dehydrogenase
MKIPGSGFTVQPVNIDFRYADLANSNILTDYERLLLDCMNGDSTLYSRADAMEASWRFLEPIQYAWQQPDSKMYGYPAGTWGPENANRLFDSDKQSWRYPCRNLTNDGEYCEL